MKYNKYIYSHINPDTNKVFYVGAKMYENDRINDINQRNEQWELEVEKIGGFDKVLKRIEHRFCENATLSEMRAKEYAIAKNYYDRGENYCSFESDISGENNPNYGNKWSKEQRKAASKRMKNRYVGGNNPNYNNKWTKKQREMMSKRIASGHKGAKNPNSKECKLYLGDGRVLHFNTKNDMVAWSKENIGSTLRTLEEGVPHTFHKKEQQRYNGTYFKTFR